MGASRGKKKGRASSAFGKENERPDPKKGVVGRLSAGAGLWHVPCGPSLCTKSAEAPSLGPRPTYAAASQTNRRMIMTRTIITMTVISSRIIPHPLPAF